MTPKGVKYLVSITPVEHYGHQCCSKFRQNTIKYAHSMILSTIYPIKFAYGWVFLYNTFAHFARVADTGLVSVKLVGRIWVWLTINIPKQNTINCNKLRTLYIILRAYFTFEMSLQCIVCIGTNGLNLRPRTWKALMTHKSSLPKVLSAWFPVLPRPGLFPLSSLISVSKNLGCVKCQEHTAALISQVTHVRYRYFG